MAGCHLEAFSNDEAIQKLGELYQSQSIHFQTEPADLQEHWPRIAASSLSSHRVWTDAYLAAFAISTNLQLVTFDKGFKNYQRHGLHLELLES